MYVEGQSMGSGPWSIKIYADDKVFLDHRTTDALNLALEMPLESVLPVRTPNIRVAIEVPEGSSRFLFIQKVQLQN